MEQYLIGLQGKKWCDIYKFMGDGWIVFVKSGINGNGLLDELTELEEYYDQLFYECVMKRLEIVIPMQGLTYGVDSGSVQSVKLHTGVEYIGRPLNISARLQSAIKDKDKFPMGKVLFSPQAYYLLFTGLGLTSKFKVIGVKRKLRNINNDEDYICRKIILNEDNPHLKINIKRAHRPLTKTRDDE